METIKINNVIGVRQLFKSYYVVWKLDFACMLESCGRMFKSYYVVWKRERCHSHSWGRWV